MTKIEGLRRMINILYGGWATVKSTDNGQMYVIREVYNPLVTSGIIYVDILKGGRVSIKIKYFDSLETAERFARGMYNWLYSFTGIVVDAATKADAYKIYSSRFRGPLYAARLRCDKWW